MKVFRIHSKRQFKKVLDELIKINMNPEAKDFVCSTEFKFNLKTYKGYRIFYSPLVDKRRIYLMQYIYE
jgi:hypothetical protein